MKMKTRTLLGLLHFGARGPDAFPRTRLMKYAFLLAQNGRSKLPDSARYDFVPYNYGPFSFELYHDLSKLCDCGYVTHDGSDGPLRVSCGSEAVAAEQVEALPWEVREALSDVAAAYRDRGQDELLREVYSRFPWYAVSSERPDLLTSPPPRKPEAELAVYTAGYEAQSVDGFFDALLRTGIRAILDVRRNPVSRKYGFSRRAMAGIAAKLDLGYVHMPGLGIESHRRKDLHTREDYERLLAWYEGDLPRRAEHVQAAAEQVASQPTVLTCVEEDPSTCHRSRLARALSRRTGLPVRNLKKLSGEGAS